MRITIDTDAADAISADGKPLLRSATTGIDPTAAIDAGTAPIDHIRRMSGLGDTGFTRADASEAARSRADADGGRSASLESARMPDRLAEAQADAKTPLNPLRAGAAAAARRVGSAQYIEYAENTGIACDAPNAPLSAIDGGAAAHIASRDAAPSSPEAEAPARKRGRAAKSAKPRGKR